MDNKAVTAQRSTACPLLQVSEKTVPFGSATAPGAKATIVSHPRTRAVQRRFNMVVAPDGRGRWTGPRTSSSPDSSHASALSTDSKQRNLSQSP